MKILLVGECSYLHNTLKHGLVELGHDVSIMSDGNGWHNSPRDIDIRRASSWGRLGGLKVLLSLLRNVRKLCGNDIVQLSGYTFLPLKATWNRLLFRFLKCTNRRVVMGCFSDDPQILLMQSRGVPSYSDTYWSGKAQNQEANRQRIFEHNRSEYARCWRCLSGNADALVACLYEYYLCYDTPSFHSRLFYIPLPMEVPPHDVRKDKVRGGVIRVLVGVQPGRDYLKGAMRIARFVESVSARHSGKVRIDYAEGVPYDDYMRMLSEADVLVDQLYSYTPSMNSLAAMARGTVVIGGGEEDFYTFIGEHTLRPIINVRPDVSDEENISAIEKAFFTENTLARKSDEGLAFVRKYHDFRRVAEQYEQLYRKLLTTQR